MTLRCGQCGAEFRPPLGRAGRDLRCPACGAAVPGPTPPPAPALPTAEPPPRAPFPDALPRAWALVIGVLVLAVMSAPFWFADLLGQGKSRPPLLPLEETTPATEKTALPGPPPGRPALGDRERPTPPGACQQYGEIRLEMTRELVQQRFHLQLRNTRGMQPEIYQAADQAGVKLLVAHFYQEVLKEFYLVPEPTRAVPRTIVAELRAQLGSPLEWSPADQPLVAPGLGQEEEIWTRLLASYRWQQRLAWSDGDHRLEATIYSTSRDPQLCTSLLVVHVSDPRWLEANRPRLPTTPAPPTGPGTNAPAAPATPPPEPDDHKAGEPFRLLPE
jgi:hypothetical protein